jgi:hypothetical protein
MIAVKEVAGVSGISPLFCLTRSGLIWRRPHLRDVMEMVIRYLRNREVAD